MRVNFLAFLLICGFLCFGQNAKTEMEKFIPIKENYSFATVNFNVPAFDRKQKIDSVSFEGSLIVPKTAFDKVVIIKPGTGYNTRNTHTDLAEALLDRNIAVFRYDERQKGNSKGSRGSDMLYTASMMGAELERAFNTLTNREELKGKKIGVIGHSIGGIAAMDALKLQMNPDFLVILSSPVISGKELFIYQLKHKENGINDYFKYDSLEEKESICSHLIDFYLAHPDEKRFWKLYRKEIKKIGYSTARYSSRFPFLLGATDRDLAIKDNSPLYRNLSIPLFYMIGDQDILVDPVANVALLKSYANPKITIEVLEGENHFFAEGYSYDIHQNPKDKIVEWILQQ
ncbi:alpha/beta hydrolase [Flavobacterium sp. NKUCC04_CG]|uniref:alpha/beta hydrolase n=1 Tax=Flavobacterium sp. NKUCC04_CG TaxID=2842121 RepID=UPI001C5BE9B4|nr:alpha/beta fold hydrolase [Flavobacterium sp. NKUCC04_CG]MBW3518059.1 lysophospholipase [Flavobacterium sp. NKUCC04_CG]